MAKFPDKIVNNRIHLLFLVDDFDYGGAQKHLVGLLNKINDKSFVLSLIILKNKTKMLAQINKQKIKNILLWHVNHKFDLKILIRIANFIKINAVDIVLCVNEYPLLYGISAKTIANNYCKVIDIYHSTLNKDFKPSMKERFMRSFLLYSDHVVFVCENQKIYWTKEIGMKIKNSSVIHNGVDKDFLEYSIDFNEVKSLREKYGILKDDYLVGICAVLREEKRHTDLIDAICLLKDRGIKAKLLFIGDGPEKLILKKYISKKNIQKEIIFTGFKNDVRPMISICDCMAISSHNIETFSIAALESMALGKPMIMSNIGGASEQVIHDHNGYLYEKGNIFKLAEYIEQLGDIKNRNRMAKAAKQMVINNFKLDSMIAKYENLIKRIY